jgi:NAD(P)H-flavin reductase/ferredoxin
VSPRHITVREDGRVLEGREDQSILDACLIAGVAAPYNCRSGECGECIARLISGEVSELPGADPAVFDQSHRDQGLVLTCLSYPRSDVEVSVTLRGEAGPQIGECDAVIETVRRPGASVVELSLRTAEPVAYEAGQYFDWLIPAVAPDRSYSAANRPGSGLLEFHVRLFEGGVISDRLTSGRLAKGDTVRLRGPFGSFRLSKDEQRLAILVAGSTGLAPIKAMLEQAFAKPTRRKIQFFYGTRTQDDLYCLEALGDWVKRFPGFEFVPVLSEEPADSDWQGARGWVTDTVAREVRDAFGAEAFLCGPPPMIDAAIAALRDLGLDPSDIHYDKFTPSGARSQGGEPGGQ